MIWVDDTGKVTIQIWPVMFGYRVQGWFGSPGGLAVNWCGGADPKHVSALFGMLRRILESREPDIGAFRDLPLTAARKPFMNDLNFVYGVLSNAPDGTEWSDPFEQFTGDELHEWKLKALAPEIEALQKSVNYDMDKGTFEAADRLVNDARRTQGL